MVSEKVPKDGLPMESMRSFRCSTLAHKACILSSIDEDEVVLPVL